MLVLFLQFPLVDPFILLSLCFGIIDSKSLFFFGVAASLGDVNACTDDGNKHSCPAVPSG